MNEHYVILDLENSNQFLGNDGRVIFKHAKEFFSRIDAGIFLKDMAPPGYFTILTVYRVTEY